MAASSSKTSEIPTSGCLRNELLSQDEVQPSEIPKLADQPVTPHDIFLSHSGKQKGFVMDLYDELSHRGFNTFFDLTHHSLPLAENFPRHIFSAAKDCKLAVVVLSEEFVSSRWPMIELSAFVKAGVEILPLFFKLSPKDFKDDINLKRWENAWEVFSTQDTRIKPTEWGNAIKVLCSKNGLTFEGEAVEGETTYIRRVVSGICEKVPVEFKFDGPHIHGMNRLCQVILDNFKNKESPGKVNVLGLYGLPGSGKSTLCQHLSDHFLPIYGGRSLCLELPTNPSTADLVQTFTKLLDLTDFKNRFNTEISKLERLYTLLENYQLPSCRVFLVIDNISDDTWGAAQMFLRLVRGPGSKVILVGRTFNILRSAFLLLKQYEQHYIWEDMEIPSIQETEAIQILLQTSCVGTVAVKDGHAVRHINLTPTQRETIVRIVHMCNFGSYYYPQYLPLVMKTMGAMLIRYDGDFVGWGSDLQKFWDDVKGYKERALIELVKESFKALPDEKLQLLFFDLSLFIVPLDLHSLEEVYVLLSRIYDGRTVADIRLMIKDLERHCFLTIGEETLGVHDVYLEFAKSFSRFNRYSWRNDKYTHANDVKPVLSLKEVLLEAKDDGPVRTMILEMQGDGYERVELQGFSSLKALFVRNCESLEVLGLVGLSSLASLDIVNCPNFRHVDGTLDLYNVKRLRISSPEGAQAGDKGAITFLHANRGWPGEALVARILKWWQTPERCSLGSMGIATKMRGLQDLRLENTGIRRLIDMGSCWPQLQNLRVKECYLEAFEVGNLPNLKSFYFSMDYFDYEHMPYSRKEKRETQVWVCKNNPRFMLQGKGLLEGCPQLEQAEIEFAFSERGELGTLPPNIKSIRLGFFYPARIFPGFSPSPHTALEQVQLEWCEKLEKISFVVEFRKLTELYVIDCHSLMEITGLNFLFSLRFFRVLECSNLRAILGPFDNLKMLEDFEVYNCPKLTGLAGADLENLVSIQLLRVPLKRGRDRHQRFNLKNLQNLCHLRVTSWQISDDDESDCCTSTNMQQLGGMLEGLEDLVNLGYIDLDGGRILHEPSLSNHKHESTKPALRLSFRSLVGMNRHHAQTLGIQPSTSLLCSIRLCNLSDLASMDGLDQLYYLPKVSSLTLEYLENLRSLQGIEGLVHLECFYVRYCPMLEELPSLHTLLSLHTVEIQYCSNLKYVEGADEIVKSGRLDEAKFEGCTSLVHLPISVDALTKFAT